MPAQDSPPGINERLAAFWRTQRFPILLGLALRLGLSLWLALVWWTVEPHLPLQGQALQEIYGRLAPRPTRLGRAVLDVWLRWDAVHYMNLAQEGYAGVGPGETNFLPLYPYLVMALKPLSGGDPLLAGLLLSTLAAILALMALQQLAREVFGDERLARWATLAWAIYPTSFFLFGPYTEALFSAWALGSLLLMYRRRWLLSGLLAALAGLTRAQGVLLVFPLALFAWQDWRRDPGQPVFAQLAGLLLAPLGFLGFTLWRMAQGVGFYNESFSQYSKIVFFDPVTGYLKALEFALRVRDYISVSEALSVTFFLGLALWMCTQPRYRRQPALLVYIFVNLALFTSKHTLTASPIQSANRYVISLYPAFIGLADLLLRLPKAGRRVYALFSLIGWLLASLLQTLWLFVG